MRRFTLIFTAVLLLVAAAAPGPARPETPRPLLTTLKKVEGLWKESQQASWIQSNFITDDSEAVSAAANQRAIDYGVTLAKEAAKYDGVQLPADMRRKIDLLKNGLTLATPSNPDESKEVTKIAASLEATYGKGKYCKTPDNCMDIDKITEIMAKSRNAGELLDVWKGWNSVSPPMRKDFTRFVELSNKAPRNWVSPILAPCGDRNTISRRRFHQGTRPAVGPGAPVVSIAARLRTRQAASQVRIRRGARRRPIPAHLFGNIWAQDWSNVYDLVAPRAVIPATTRQDSRKPQDRRRRHGEVRRGFLRVAGI